MQDISIPPENDIYLRELIADWNCENSQRAWLNLLHEGWKEFNKRFFGGVLSAPVISTGLTGPNRLGDCRLNSDIGPKMQITIANRVFRKADAATGKEMKEGAKRLIQDILLHEMIHQFVVEGLKKNWDIEKSWHGHGPIFRDQCQRISRMLGIDQDVGTKHQKTLPPCALWPLCVRPIGYYRGFYEVKTKKKKAKETKEKGNGDWDQGNLDPKTLGNLILASAGMIRKLGQNCPDCAIAAQRLPRIVSESHTANQVQLVKSAVLAIEQILRAVPQMAGI